MVIHSYDEKFNSAHRMALLRLSFETCMKFFKQMDERIKLRKESDVQTKIYLAETFQSGPPK